MNGIVHGAGGPVGANDANAGEPSFDLCRRGRLPVAYLKKIGPEIEIGFVSAKIPDRQF